MTKLTQFLLFYTVISCLVHFDFSTTLSTSQIPTIGLFKMTKEFIRKIIKIKFLTPKIMSSTKIKLQSLCIFFYQAENCENKKKVKTCNY